MYLRSVVEFFMVFWIILDSKKIVVETLFLIPGTGTVFSRKWLRRG